MLAEALQAEVDAYIAQFADERDEKRASPGGAQRLATSRATVLTGAGAVTGDCAAGQRQAVSTRIPVSGSGFLRRSCRRGRARPRKIERGAAAAVPARAVVGGLRARAGAVPRLARRACRRRRSPGSPRPGRPRPRAFGERDLSGVDYVYLWADGIHLNDPSRQEKLCLLVMIGVRADGRKELVALTDGYREVDRVVGRSAARRRAAACAPRCWPPGTGRSGSGARCARCSRTPASSVVGSTRYRMFLPRCRSRRTRGRRRRSQRSGTPRTSRHAPRRGQGVRVDLRCEVSEGGRQDHRRRRAAAGLLRLPGRALDPSENDKPDRYLKFLG